ncbi:hypothetical protein [Streptomyces sp. CB01373]|uniref:hypothetical protein n=1 Tax=Streptomyces sp. CB01373 TaxID=2020325 RepID=UPI0018FE81A3|nr:hypothetical protein [Streptomyces sp. CB01373]
MWDNRGFGDSDQHALTYAQNRPEVDPDRIGVWGSSFTGGHAFVAAGTPPAMIPVIGDDPARVTCIPAAPMEGRISGIVGTLNACCSLCLPAAVFDFGVRPSTAGPAEAGRGQCAPAGV